MCFSAEADLFAGVFAGAVAVDAARHIGRPSDKLLVAIPAVFAAHQLVEAVVWRGLEGAVDQSIWRPAMWTYLVIAFVIVPALVPLAIAAIEPAWIRRRMIVPVGGGIAVAVTLLVVLLTGPADARIDGHHINYSVDLPHGGVIVSLYVLATCTTMLLSGYRHVRWYGLVNLAAVAALVIVDRTALISLWCAWAALTSVAIAAHLRAQPVQLRPRRTYRRPAHLAC